MTRNKHLENIETTGKIIGLATAVTTFIGGILYIIKQSMEIHSHSNNANDQTQLAGSSEDDSDIGDGLG